MWKAIKPKPPRQASSPIDCPESATTNTVVDDDDDLLHEPISMMKALVLPSVLPVSFLCVN